MKLTVLGAALALIATSASAAKTCDDISDRKRRANCKAGQESAKAYEEEAAAWNKAAKLRDKVCIADGVAGAAAAKAAGWKGKIVYKGTREAANWITKGASRC